MKKMKNIICVLLAISMCLGLTACGSGTAEKSYLTALGVRN